MKLPISVGLKFVGSDSGPIHVDVRLALSGQSVGGGQGDGTLQSGQHTTIDVPVDSGNPPADMNGDQGTAPQDSGTDLAMTDLKTTPDLSTGGPIFGDPNIEGSTDTHNPGLADASNYLSSQSGNVGHLSAYLNGGDVSLLVIGLYDDQGGHPHTLLGSGTVVGPMINAWNTVAIVPVPVLAGTIYWIAIVGELGSGTSFSFPYGTFSGPTTEHSMEMNLNAMPAVWTTGATFPNTKCSFYASP